MVVISLLVLPQSMDLESGGQPKESNGALSLTERGKVPAYIKPHWQVGDASTYCPCAPLGRFVCVSQGPRLHQATLAGA
jgi:hypothetical protein